MTSEENNISSDTEKKEDRDSKIIKHIVCSGGGLAGFAFYGAIQECHNQHLWQLENIETIYGTSVGTILAVILALNYDWVTLDDYLIKRPWQQVFSFNLYSILESIQRRGIFDINIIADIFLPLFSGKDIAIDITLLEYYEITNIEIHMFATNVNTFELTDISYKTHPDWKLIDAVYSSCSVPVIFSPFFKNNECYCDGALFSNYPVKQCIDNGANPDEILGIGYNPNNNGNDIITTNSSLFDYIVTVIKKYITSIIITPSVSIAYEYFVSGPTISIYDILNTTSDPNIRIELIEQGKQKVVKSLSIGTE